MYKPKRIIIWGYPLGTHTHSFIHAGFYYGTIAAGYEVLWLDDMPLDSPELLNDALVISEHNVIKNLPLNPTCKYAILYLPRHEFEHREGYVRDNMLCLNLFDYSAVGELVGKSIYNADCHMLYITFPTDLMPSQINLDDVTFQREHVINYVGTISEGTNDNMKDFSDFARAAKEDGKPVIVWGGYTGSLHIDNVSVNPGFVNNDQHRQLIKLSYLAPSIQSVFQVRAGYVADRIFKNISYGQWPGTNNPATFKYFDELISYNPNCYDLYYGMKADRENNTRHRWLMLLVKEQHTYVNRINEILSVL